MLVLVSGVSGAGKSTVINKLMEKNKNYRRFASCTTRDMRPGEVDGVSYFFLNKEQFLEYDKQGKFAEIEEIHGNYYGSLVKDIQNAISGKDVVIKDIGVEGLANIRQIVGEENVLSIFIDVPKDVLRARLTDRGETQIDLRLSRYEYEHEEKFLKLYNNIVQNINLDDCVKEFEVLIKNFQKKMKHKENCGEQQVRIVGRQCDNSERNQ